MNRYLRIKDHVWAEVYALTYARLIVTLDGETAAHGANAAANSAVERMLIDHSLHDPE